MTISEALRQLVDDEVLTVKAIAHAAKRSPSTVYRWLSLESAAEPSATEATRLIRELTDRRARDLLAMALLADTGYRAERPPTDLDTNHDGKTDLYDVAEDLHNAIDLWQRKSRTLTTIRREGQVSEAMHDMMVKLGANLIAEIERAMATITEIYRAQPPRRKASPVPDDLPE